MNVIVIVSDTFRRDHLGCYGNSTIQTPHLDRFSKECIQLENCYATSFPTMPMRADLFTGRFTFTYLGWQPLPQEEILLAEVMRKANYTTLAAVDTPFFIRQGYGYDRGFKDYQWVQGQGDQYERERIDSERRYESNYCAPMTIAAAEKFLEYYYKENFFLYVDTWDPHEPWDPPSWYVTPYSPEYDGRTVYPCYWDWREKGLKKKDLEVAHACYCGEISMVDHWIGRLLDKVKVMNLWNDTVIIFTSDHGFYFGEHGFFGKLRIDLEKDVIYQSPLYQEITRVPLLIYVPGMEGRRIEALASSVDIMPTILDLVRLEIPETVQGKSLLPLLQGKDSVRDFVVTSPPLYNPGEQSKVVDDWLRIVDKAHFTTVTTSAYSFLYSSEDTPAQLYNIVDDPKESQNIIGSNSRLAEDLHGKLVALLREVGTGERFLSVRKKLRSS